MANTNLGAAKAARNDEFYTQYHDIEREVNAYLEYDPDVFRGKTILLPCDDPEWSNFTKYFAQNFDRFGLKRLISTSYAPESKKYKNWEPTLFETEDPKFDEDKSKTSGKIFILDRDKTGDGRINVNDLVWDYLEGDGDFRSDEIKRLRDEADFIITNPPFSLFREFLAWIVEADKRFLVIGNMNAITYKEVFPLIKENKMWLGATGNGTDMVFAVPKGTEVKEEGTTDSYRIKLKILVGVYDDNANLQGYRDSLEIIEKIRQYLLSLENRILGERYQLQMPMSSDLDGGENFPFFFGEINTVWETARPLMSF